MIMVAIKRALSFVLDAIGHIGSILWILILLGVVKEPILGSAVLSDYLVAIFVLFALSILYLSALWLGYQIHARRTRTTVWSEDLIAKIDNRFLRLKFHFSRITDTATGSHEKPNYVVTMDTEPKKAYPIPSELEPYLKNVLTNWEAHNGIDELKNHFRINEIEIHPEQPEIEKDLGLVTGWDGKLHLRDLAFEEFLAKLNGKKIKGATIVKFYPFYRYGRSKPPYTPNRLLIKHNTKPKEEAWWSPFHDLDLIEKHLIDCDICTKLPYWLWCEWHHYDYVRHHSDEVELLKLLGESEVARKTEPQPLPASDSSFDESKIDIAFDRSTFSEFSTPFHILYNSKSQQEIHSELTVTHRSQRNQRSSENTVVLAWHR
jgi:hypothetical protein